VRDESQRSIPGMARTSAARRPLGVGLALGIVGLIASFVPGAFGLEQRLGLGLLFAVRGPLPAPTDVVVVGISRDSARVIGQTAELDTWPRDVHAALLDRLDAEGASAVAFDLMFHELRPGTGDALFAASIEHAGNVVLLERTESDVRVVENREVWLEKRTPPLPELKHAALGSAPFVLPTVPITVGQFWTFGRASDDQPSLPALAAQAHLLPYYEELVRLVEGARPGTTATWPKTIAAVREGRALERLMQDIRRAFAADSGLRAATQRELSHTDLPAEVASAVDVLIDLYAGPSTRFLNLYGPARGVPTLPYDRALDTSARIDVAGKLLLVGASEPRQPEQQDDFVSVFSQSTGINLSGVELGATAVANLLDRRAITPLSLPVHAALIVVLGIAFGVLVSSRTTLRAAALAALAGGAYFAAAYWLFAREYLWLPLVVPLAVQLTASFAAALWWSYRELAEQRERVRTALGYYVPRSLVHSLTQQTLTPGADRQLLHGTCLVTDAEQYTSVAERLPPDRLASLMNDYYSAIFRVVQAHGGEISDTAGDSMVAVWASSKPDAGARRRAARAALAIVGAVEEFNRAHAESPLPTRVGLESGEMLLGNIGAEQRYEYRAVGDIVNTASRIQGLNQLLGTRVLISAATLEGVDVPARDVGTFLLRGKRLPVRILEPLSGAPDSPDEQGLDAFASALTAFRGGDWAQAHESFTALSRRFASDGPTRYYVALSAAMRESPPAAWAGVIRVTAK
jgi:adenylate cyclase